MFEKKQVLLKLEALEDRWVPATIRYASGTLLINNTSPQASSVSLSSVGNKVTVTLGTQSSTYSGVGNIDLTNGNGNTTISTAGLSGYNGGLLIQTGNGNDAVTIGGTQSGNTNLIIGNGTDSLTLAGTYSTNGDFQFTSTSRSGVDSLTVANGAHIGGNLTVTGANVTVGAATVGGSLTVNDGQLTNNTNVSIGAATIGQNLNLTTGAGNDSVTLAGTTAANGTTQINEGSSYSGNNVFTTTGTVALGSLSFNTGGGNDAVTLSTTTTVSGDAGFTFGSGADTVTSNAAFSGAFNLQAGDGADSVTLNGSVGGAAFVQLGNGLADDLTVTNSVGGLLTFQLGNGDGDSVNLLPTTPTSYEVNGTFGNGNNDAFTLDSNVSISGTVTAGNPSTAVFNQNSATIVSPFSINF